MNPARKTQSLTSSLNPPTYGQPGRARKPRSAAAALVPMALLALISACGSKSNGAASSTSTETTGGALQFPTNSTGQTQYGDVSSLPSATLDALVGTYDGKVYKRVAYGADAFSGQNFTMTLSVHQITSTVNGQSLTKPFIGVKIESTDSAGPWGAFSFTTDMALGAVNGTYYDFATEIGRVKSFYDYPFSMEFYFTIASGQKAPTQSLIYIKDCGFSQITANSGSTAQNSACSLYSQDVGFGGDLRKRL